MELNVLNVAVLNAVSSQRKALRQAVEAHSPEEAKFVLGMGLTVGTSPS